MSTSLTKKNLDAMSLNPKAYAKTLDNEKLVKLLEKLSDSYYNSENGPRVSDEVFDELRDALKKRDPSNAYLKKVGAPIRGTKNKVLMPYPMSSFDKVKLGDGQLDKKKKKYHGPYVLSDKLDGGSVQIYKDDNGTITMYSRGDYTYGQDLTHLVKSVTSENSLKKLPKGASVRGELMISKEDFKNIEHHKKNTRNAVAGVINAKTVNEEVLEYTNVVTYAVLNPRMKQSDQMKMLKKWGFNVVPYKVVDDITNESLAQYWIERYENSDYDLDGIVCVDDGDIYELGEEFPSYAFAFKMTMKDQIKTTKIISVTWTPSMDGYIKPKINIEPVELDGVTVKRATAFNAKYIYDNKIGKGSEIKIIRSGFVIPYILEVTKPSKTGKADMPNIPYKWNSTKVDIIVDTSDENVNKSTTNTITVKALCHFISTMKIKYLAEGTIVKLVENGYTTIKSILEADHNELAEIEGLGEKNIKKIFAEMDNAFDTVELHTFMAASHKFGRGLAEKKLYEVVKMYPNILTVKWNKQTMIDNISQVEGFSTKLATLFAENFSEFMKFYKMMNKLKDLTRFEDIPESDDESNSDDSDDENNNVFEKKSIVITGFRGSDYDKLSTYVKKHGGKIGSSVSSKTFLVVHKDGDDVGKGKMKTARELKIPTISKSSFIKKYNIDL
jgi:DNA ligase (NAD+)